MASGPVSACEGGEVGVAFVHNSLCEEFKGCSLCNCQSIWKVGGVAFVHVNLCKEIRRCDLCTCHSLLRK